MAKLIERVRKAMPGMQPAIENMLGVRLGDIKISCLTDKANDLDFEGMSTVARRFDYFVTWLDMAEKEVLGYAAAEAGYSAIYVTRNPFVNCKFPNEESIDRLTSHELAHIAHSRLLGFGPKDDKVGIRKLPFWIGEGFAEYVSKRAVALKYGKPIGEVWDDYGCPDEIIIFNSQLSAAGFGDCQGAVKFTQRFVT